jgi:PAS domain S-box-containing protein
VSDVLKVETPDPVILRMLANSIPAMLAYWGADQRCRFANRAYERWFGVSPESLIGKHTSELLGPLYELNRPYIEGVLRGVPQEFEREIPNPSDGPSRHALANYIPDIVDGAVRGFFVLVTDISAVKLAELALRESEERFRLTIDEAPIGMAIVARDGRFVRVNRVLCEIVGYTDKELTGLAFQAITHPEDLDADLVLAAQLERGEISRYKLDKRYIRKDGSSVHVRLSGSALRGADGVPLMYIAQIEDITDEKRLEREQAFLASIGPVLADTLDYEGTLSHVADLAVSDIADLCILDLLDDAGEVRRLKVAARDVAKAWVCTALTGVPLDRRRPHLMHTVFETKAPILMPHVTREAVASFAQSEEHHRALEAAEIASMVAVPLLAHGRLLGAMALIASPSSRAYGLADVRLAEELARRAALAIENARLYRAARRATEARDEILGVVAHDLRSPLHVILGQAALLRTRAAGAGQVSPAAAESIERAAIQMNCLIEDLLDTSRLEAGGLHVEPVLVPASDIIRRGFEAQSPAAAAMSIALRLDVPADLPTVWADRRRIGQVFDNLIGNAIKFTPAGGSVTVGATASDGDVVFWVRDTGRGIAARDLPRVFDKFWQADKAERRGAGLGLTIASSVVEAHGGRIWVESTEGEGSTFSFTLPSLAPSTQQPESSPQPLGRERHVLADRGGLTGDQVERFLTEPSPTPPD